MILSQGHAKTYRKMKRNLRILLICVVIGAILGIGQMLISFNKQTGETSYYADLCQSTEGCCPGEREITADGSVCPRKQAVRGFPIMVNPSQNQNLLLLNVAIWVIVIPALGLTMVRLRSKFPKKAK
ncbi:MAG: hypothetical protein V4702_00135 [Patescibacteria group bacterium]